MKIFEIILSIVMLSSAHPLTEVQNAKAVVDRIEGDYAVVEFSNADTSKMLDILYEDINIEVTDGSEISVKSADGKFYGDFTASNNNGAEDTYYQFRSDNDEVWWALTTDEIGFVPDKDIKYTLYYSDNWTTKENPPCDCAKEYECECYCYDDIFFGIEVSY